MTADKIAEQLNAFDIPAPRGRMWRSYTIYSMLNREEYTGRFFANKFKRTLNPVTGKYSPTERPREEWIPIVREDLRIIADEVYEAARDRLKGGKGVTAKYDYLFSRRVKCQYNHKMTCTFGSDYKGRKRHYYACRTNKWLLKTCDMPYFHSQQVDQRVWCWVMDLIEDPDAVLVEMKKAQEKVDTSNQQSYEWLEAIERLISEKTKERDYLIEEARHFRDNLSVREKYRSMIEEISKALDELEEQQREYLKKVEQDRLSDQEIAQRTTSIKQLNLTRETLEQLPFTKKREIIRLLNIHIHLGVTDGKRWCDVIWYGDTDRIMLDLETR